MTPCIKEFMSIASKTLPLGKLVYEFGARQCNGQEGWADMRVFFPGHKYVGTDIETGPGVDEVMDVQMLDLDDDKIDAAVFLETIEHVEHPFLAVGEIARVLKPDGFLLFSTVMKFTIHCAPRDYWRFTPYGVDLILKPHFKTRHVFPVGMEKFPKHVVAVATRQEVENGTFGPFMKRAKAWNARWNTKWTRNQGR